MRNSKIKAKGSLMIMFVIKILQFCLFGFKRNCLNLLMLQHNTQFKLLQHATQSLRRKITVFMHDCQKILLEL